MKLLILILFISNTAYSQEKQLSAIYFELLGSGGLFSINYERVVSTNNTMRVGVSYFDLYGENINVKFTAFPIMFNHLLFPSRNQLELSGGVVIVAKQQSKPSLITDSFYDNINRINGVTYVGYRDWNEDSNFIFRIGCTQLFNNHGVFVNGGISFGILF